MTADLTPEALDRPRVSFTHGSIQGVVVARKRHVCQNHLDVERHYIEPGDRYVANALPPDNPDIGNPGWWHLRMCLDCCPAEHDPRLAKRPHFILCTTCHRNLPAPDVTALPDGDGTWVCGECAEVAA